MMKVYTPFTHVLVLHGESLCARPGPNSLMSWVHWQQVHNAAVVARSRSLGCQCDSLAGSDTEIMIPTGRTLTET